MSDRSNNHLEAVAGSADPLDRGTGRGASGGGLAEADFVPAHGDGKNFLGDFFKSEDSVPRKTVEKPAPQYDEATPLDQVKDALVPDNPLGKSLDDEMKRPKDERSPLT